MSARRFRDASEAQVDRLIRPLLAARLFADEAALRAVHHARPWAIQVNERGDVAVLDRWRTEALEGMQEALLHRNRTPEQAIEINRLYRRIGELTMQTEILEAAMKLRGVTDFPKGKSRL